jgi:AcrR family transcriptional regulator
MATHPSPEPPRHRRNPQSTRDRIVRAAIDLFTTQGYHATTTPQIAAAGGVAEGSIYRHFESKRVLLNELYRAALRLLLAPITATAGSCQDRLAHVAQTWCELANHDPAPVRLVFFTRFPGLLDPKSRDLAAELRVALSRILVQGKSSGEIRPGSVDLWTDLWIAIVSLPLERICDKTWTVRDPQTQLALRAAWHAVHTAEGGAPTP